ncbi:MAG: isopentenyl phosphate kinase family protein [Candidatus Thorarchaeota archaeon]|nr:isopentenyl phosphate kinase family protein [Candidatus Thorarchaeota archaeon]
MTGDVTVLKLGGSLLTDKSKPYTAREDVIRRVAHDIRDCLDSGLLQSLVLLHGVGSFGHPPVLEHGLHKGFRDKSQLMPLTRTQQKVNEYRLMLVKHMHEAGLPVNLMHPSSMIVSEGMRISSWCLDPLKGYLDLGTIPFLGGDVIFDRKMGFSVGSADQMAVLLTRELSAKRLLFATDVAGVFDRSPKAAGARFMPEIHLKDLDRLFAEMGATGAVDATGAMKGKLSSLLPIADMIEKGLEVSILSLMREGSLRSHLTGSLDCTRIRA